MKFFQKNKKNFSYNKGTYVDSDSTFRGESIAMEYCHIRNTDAGRYVSMADFTSIGVEEPDFDKISTSPRLNDERKPKRTILKNDIWIGVDSMVKEGVTVGNCTVIGSNSYVREDVPDFAIVGGNPAKIIRYRFNEKTRQKILESKYWNYSPRKAKKIISKIQSEYNEKKKVS